MGGNADPGQLSGGAISADRTPPGQTESDRGGHAYRARDCVHLLREGTPYRELGGDYFDTLNTARLERHHVNRLKALGHEVVLTPARAA